MRPLPSLPRFLCGADSEVAHQTIQFFLCVGLTTVFFSDPSSQAPYDWNYVYYMLQIPHHTPNIRVAVKDYAPYLQRDGLLDTCLAWQFM